MNTVRVVFGKKSAKFYNKDNQISLNTAFGMYKNKALFVVNGNRMNLSRFGTTECPVCFEPLDLIKPFSCTHGVCDGCSSKIALTTKNCPMCRAKPNLNEDIYEAAENGNYGLVAQLAENGADLNLKDKKGWAPAHHAAGNVDDGDKVMRVLVQYGADLNIQIKHANERVGSTPAMIAAEVGAHKVMKILADAGADLDLWDGQTPLSMAISNEHLETVRVLVNEGATVDLTLGDGLSPLGEAIQNLEDFESTHTGWKIVRVLVDAGANVNFSDHRGRTPLYIAAESGDNVVVRMLIDAGANVNVNTYNGETPLHIAAKGGEKGNPALTVRMLLDNGANMNLGLTNNGWEDPKGATPVWMAAYNGNTDIVEILVTRGVSFAKIDLVDREEGLTPLWMAASRGDNVLVRILIENGANPFKKSRSTWLREISMSPLDIARARGNQRVIDILEPLEKKRAAVMVRSVIRQEDIDGTRRPLPEDMETVINGFL